MFDTIVNKINILLKNDNLRISLLIITGIFAGYTLNPVPKLLNNLFHNSHLFKFIILLILGILAVHPIDKNELFYIIITSIIILIIFEITRLYD